MPLGKRVCTKEVTLKELNSYPLTDLRRKMMVDFINKICLSVSVPIPMYGNDEGNFGPMDKNMPGVYWDNDTHYIDVEINEGDQNLSLYGRHRNTPKNDELWIESFTVDKPDEPFPQEWLETYFKPFLLQK